MNKYEVTIICLECKYALDFKVRLTFVIVFLFLFFIVNKELVDLIFFDNFSLSLRVLMENKLLRLLWVYPSLKLYNVL